VRAVSSDSGCCIACAMEADVERETAEFKAIMTASEQLMMVCADLFAVRAEIRCT
jgi:hypothetical protein